MASRLSYASSPESDVESTAGHSRSRSVDARRRSPGRTGSASPSGRSRLERSSSDPNVAAGVDGGGGTAVTGSPSAMRNGGMMSNGGMEDDQPTYSGPPPYSAGPYELVSESMISQNSFLYIF